MSTDARAVAEKINKKLGAGTVLRGSDIDYTEIPRITTGCLSLDVALGGGWPANQWNEVIGLESAGKTLLAFKTIAANQQRDPDWAVAWVCAEDFVEEYALLCGVDIDRVYLIDTNVMEYAYDAVIEYLDSRSVDCVVIDSLPALIPSAEGTQTMEDFQVGLGARLTGKFFRKARKAGHRSLVEPDRPVTGLMINQYRDQVGVMWGDPRTTPGGKGKNYHYFTRVEVRRDDWIDNDLTGNKKRKVGITVKAQVIKNKSAPPQKTAVFDFYFDDFEGHLAGDIDRSKDVMLVALQFEVIEKRGGFYRYGEQQWRGRDAVLADLDEHSELRQQLETEVLGILVREQQERMERLLKRRTGE